MTANEVKAALAESAEDFVRWLFPAGRKNGHNWTVGSLQGEEGKSLAICISGSKVGVFKDFATGESGDNLVELLAQAHQVEFKDALRTCAEWLTVRRGTNIYISTPSFVPQSESNGLPPPMSKSDCERALAMAMALRNDPSFCERIARARNWRVETIVDLVHEPSLGWDSGRLAFLYESGVKLRSWQEGERIIRWAFGKPWIWRGGFLWEHSTVYICEGETDCISLIDGRVEEDGHALAVAIPSATTFKSDWAQLFRGKNVILALDGDKPGQMATASISLLLQPFVKTLKHLDWERLKYAS